MAQGQDATWTSETLPLKLRRELMKRELSEVMHARHHDAHAGADGSHDDKGDVSPASHTPSDKSSA